MHRQQTYNHLSDQELLAKFSYSKDNYWLGILLQRYTALLLGVAMKYLKNKEEAEDAVQYVFMKCLTHLPNEPINNFKGWLYILMRNHCLQHLRDKGLSTTEFTEAIDAADDEDYNSKELTLQEMEAALEELNEPQKTSIELFYLKKMSYEQIIAQTGYTFMQVKSYIQNGKRNLKLLLLKKLNK